MPHPTLKPALAILAVLAPVAILSMAAPAAAEFQKRYFVTEAEALRICGSDPVVWVNKNTGVYHLKTSRWYGKTKDGAYGCQSELDRAGDHLAKVEK